MHIRQLLWKMLSGTLTGLRLRASDKEIIKLEKFVITGGKPLHGEVTISGAKNAAVGVLPATILAADVCVIENLPDISDVAVSLKILSVLGAQIKMINRNTYEIDTTHLTGTNVPDDLSRQMRASYYFLGALLSRFGKAQVAMPGGCNLGPRPIDQHLKGFAALGCDYSLVDHHTFTVGKVIVNNTPEQTGELTTEQHRSLFMRPGSMVLKIYKHSVIRENHLDFPEHIFYEDNCAGPLWSLYFRHFARVEEPLYYYYQHAVSTVHHITEEKCRDRMKAAELLYAECERRGFLTEYSREIEYRYTELYYAITLFSYMGGVTHPKLAFIRQLRKGVEERFPEFAQNPYYLERTSCNNPANVARTKAAIRKAFQNQLDGKGFSLVEIVTSCPTNWGLEPLEALGFLEEKMFKEFPLGVIRDKDKEGA